MAELTEQGNNLLANYDLIAASINNVDGVTPPPATASDPEKKAFIVDSLMDEAPITFNDVNGNPITGNTHPDNVDRKAIDFVLNNSNVWLPEDGHVQYTGQGGLAIGNMGIEEFTPEQAAGATAMDNARRQAEEVCTTLKMADKGGNLTEADIEDIGICTQGVIDGRAPSFQK